MRILIIGSNGLLGSDLMRSWPSEELIPATSNDADVQDIEQVRRLVSAAGPAWIILTAAYTNVDAAETDPQRAFRVNQDGARNVSFIAKEAGAKLLYVSTDYVFDGASNKPYEPNDPLHPISVYGASKAAGEQAVRQHAGHWIIARTSWLFGTARPCFAEKILVAAKGRKELKVVNDQYGSPTYTKDLSEAIQELVRKNAQGILNITNAGACSWFEFASEIIRRSGYKTKISPITTAEANRPARRPAYSVLSPAALAAHGITMRSWQDALDAYLHDLHEKGNFTRSV